MNYVVTDPQCCYGTLSVIVKGVDGEVEAFEKAFEEITGATVDEVDDKVVNECFYDWKIEEITD